MFISVFFLNGIVYTYFNAQFSRKLLIITRTRRNCHVLLFLCTPGKESVCGATFVEIT